MTRNIIIINNDLSALHFSGEIGTVFMLDFQSNSERSYPTNSPEFAILRVVAYCNSLTHLQRVSEPLIAEQLSKRNMDNIQIKSVETTIILNDTAIVELMVTHNGVERLETFELRLKKDEWIVTGWVMKN